MTVYQDTIKRLLTDRGLEIDPRHVEAYIRLHSGTLDGLCEHELFREIGIAVNAVKIGGAEAAERLAKSWRL